jgi:hypothetical protein
MTKQYAGGFIQEYDSQQIIVIGQGYEQQSGLTVISQNGVNMTVARGDLEPKSDFSTFYMWCS